ncbi:exodeoxyribonuclease III [Candidatus Altiarchaeota archaeon]
MSELSLVSWNVNGLRAVHKKGFLDWMKKEDADIVCLQEIKALREQLPKELIDPLAYHSYFNSAERKGYSGVALYTKIQPSSIQYGLGLPEFDNEGRVIIAEYDGFFLYAIYFPNGSASPERLDYKMRFYDAFLAHAEEARKMKPVIVCGDVNTAHKDIDIARPRENEGNSGFLPIERAWLDKLLDHGYIDTFRHMNPESVTYSWWAYKTRARERNVGWRIDYFIAGDELKQDIMDARILSDVMGSDHCPIKLVLKQED